MATILLAACATGPAPRPLRPAVVSGAMVVFEGTCDASGAVALDDHHFVLADDEDNVLRIYDAEKGGPPLWSYDLSDELDMEDVRREADLEAAARIADRAFWLASHARSKSGKREPSRVMLFATDIPRVGKEIDIEGEVYRGLLAELTSDPRYARFGLAAAAERPPQEPGGLNIEGMTSTPEGHLILAMRNPIPEGRALFVPVLNPLEITGDDQPARAHLGEPFTLDLDGRGVRELTWWRGELVILGGSYAHERATELFSWTQRPEDPPRRIEIDLADFNPEAFYTPVGRKELMVLSDDGEVEIDGKRCKKLKDARKKRFRGVWVELSP